MSTATRATGSLVLTACRSLEPFETSVPFATLPSYQNRGPA
jgi:hypothetical protein